MFKRPISTALSPNTEKDDVILAESILSGKALNKGALDALKGHFKALYGVSHVSLFNSGRSSLLAILSALNAPRESQIAIQGFTCNAVVNPILKAGCKPLYIDIDDDLNMDPSDLDRKITHECKAVIVQHTFGHPAQIEKIKEICQKHNLILIEDSAHRLGERKLIGDVAFFSFGRDKMISSVFGGAVITNNQQIGLAVDEFWEKSKDAKKEWTDNQLRHPILFERYVLPFYNFFTLGRRILSLAFKLNKLDKAVEKIECRGYWNENYPAKLPAELAMLANNQLNKLERYNNHRRELSQYYYSALASHLQIGLPFIESRKKGYPFMRFPIIVKDREVVLNKFKKRGIYLEDGWGGKNIVPCATDVEAMHYNEGMCPRAEKVAKQIVNLPTHINTSKKDAEKIIQILCN